MANHLPGLADSGGHGNVVPLVFDKAELIFICQVSDLKEIDQALLRPEFLKGDDICLKAAERLGRPGNLGVILSLGVGVSVPLDLGQLQIVEIEGGKADVFRIPAAGHRTLLKRQGMRYCCALELSSVRAERCHSYSSQVLARHRV